MTRSDIDARYTFRTIRPDEAEAANAIEQICFPPNEACSRAHMLARIAAASDAFWVAVDRETGRLAGFINGIATDETAFRDEFFTDERLHDPDGRALMILGLDVLPEHRLRGLGRALMEGFAARERGKGRRLLVLTCLDRLVPMYERMGFTDRGLSASTWGGEAWHEMERML